MRNFLTTWAVMNFSRKNQDYWVIKLHIHSHTVYEQNAMTYTIHFYIRVIILLCLVVKSWAYIYICIYTGSIKFIWTWLHRQVYWKRDTTYRFREFGNSTIQWAAVRTYFSLITEPPQRNTRVSLPTGRKIIFMLCIFIKLHHHNLSSW